MKALFLLLVIFCVSKASSQDCYICEGETKTLTAIPSLGTAPYTYQWTSPTAVVTTGATVTAAAGVWLLRITDANGCPYNTSYTVGYEAEPTLGIVASNSCLFTAQNISATGVPSGYSYSWNFGSGASPATSTSPTTSVLYSTSGTKTITLTITKSGGGDCVWVESTTISIGSLTGTISCD